MKTYSKMGWLIAPFLSMPLFALVVANIGASLEAATEGKTKERRVAEVSGQDFDAQVLESPIPVAVVFYAHWCGPCQRQSPILDQAARELDNARFVKVNVDENRELTAAYNVRSIPTLLVFEEGEVVDRHVGLATKERIKSLLKRGSAE